MVNIRRVPLTDPVNAMLKRAVDIFGAAFALLVFSPIMLLTAILIKLTAPGPLIYKQERVGLHNRHSICTNSGPWWYRPFRRENEVDNQTRFQSYPGGAFIRKTSIDEMPQFLNVLRGDMSLVGPRPERLFL